MKVGRPIAAFETLRHREHVNCVPPFAKPAKSGAPARTRLNFEVTYPSGIILTEAPSIVETTDTKRTRVGHPPTATSKSWNPYAYDRSSPRHAIDPLGLRASMPDRFFGEGGGNFLMMAIGMGFGGGPSQGGTETDWR